MTATHVTRVVTELNAREFFQDAVQSALSNQQVNASNETVCYLVNLLTCYVRAEHLFDATTDGPDIKPLALLYADALEAPTVSGRDSTLKRLGDTALFISGLFSHSLGRSLVDVDYYIQMGGNAYGFLAESERTARDTRALKVVFLELSGQFATFVDVLGEIGDEGRLNNSTDIMRLYEIWQSTGSRRVAEKLRRLGIEPVSVRKRMH